MKGKGVQRIVSIAAVLLILAALSASGIYRVGPGQEAIVLTLGGMTAKKGPGLYWRIPLLQKEYIESLSQIHTVEYGFRTTRQGSSNEAPEYSDEVKESVMLTGDDSLVNVEAVFQYQINDVRDYLFNVENPEDTMRVAFETVLRRNIQNKQLDAALLNKDTLETEVLPEFQRMLNNYGIGIAVRMVRIQNITVPEAVTSAYSDVNNAQNEKTRKLDEAERYQNEVLPAARSRAFQRLTDAEGYRAETVAKAQGDALNFESVLSEYRSAQKITRDRLLIETLESILAGSDRKIIVDGGDTLKLLPLSEEGKTPSSILPAQNTEVNEGG